MVGGGQRAAHMGEPEAVFSVLVVRVLDGWGCGPGPFLPVALYQTRDACWVVGWHLLPGGGGREPEAPRLANRAAARAVVVPHPCSFLGGTGSGTSREQADWALDWSIAAIRKLRAMYSRGRRRRPAVGMTARLCARSDWAS